MRYRYTPGFLPRARHPLLRVLHVLIGLTVLGLMLSFGIMMAGFSLIMTGIIILGGSLWLAVQRWRLGRAGRKPHPSQQKNGPGSVLEGEFTVVDSNRKNA